MTINYTTLLGLAKPVTGTESGTWGDVVNDQITSLVEDAIANAASINVTSGNVTLTDNNGSSDQSRMAILLVTGTPGVSRNIVAPSTSKWYIVKNGSNAEVVLKGSATTGVTIPAGVEALAFWNGSDFELTSMVGPSSSTDNAVVRYDGTTGKVVQNSGVTIDDSNNMTGVVALTTTGVVTIPAGTNSAPSLTFSGDTNTGIYSPAADKVSITTGGTERLQVDGSGNVGIGVTPSAWYSFYNGLQVGSSAALWAIKSGAGGVYLSNNEYLDGTVTRRYLVNGYATEYTQLSGQHIWYTAASGTAGNTISFSQAMTLDASGNLGIGTSSPSFALDISQVAPRIRQTATTGTNSSLIQLVNTGGTAYIGLDSASAGLTDAYALALYHSGAYPITFSTSGTERARITSGGEVYIAGTTDQGAYNLQVNGTGVWGAGAYVNGSDANLKEEVQDIAPALDLVAALRPVTFRYKANYSKDQSIQPGFIAQELQQAMEGQAYINGVVQAGPEYLNVAYQSLIPVLTKAIQEQQAIINDLRARVAQLETKGA